MVCHSEFEGVWLLTLGGQCAVVLLPLSVLHLPAQAPFFQRQRPLKAGGERALPGLCSAVGAGPSSHEGKPADSVVGASVWLREPFPRLAVAGSVERFLAVSSPVPSQGTPF